MFPASTIAVGGAGVTIDAISVAALLFGGTIIVRCTAFSRYDFAQS